MEAALRKGRELPDWYLDEPDIVPGYRFYLDAFFELSTTRNSSIDGIQPIPWHRIVDYANYARLDPDFVEHFVRVIRSLDATFLKWRSEERNKQDRLSSRPSGPRVRTRKNA